MHLLNWIELTRKRVKWGKKIKIHGVISLHGHGTITIGDNCIFTSSAHYNPVDGSGKCHFSTKFNGKLIIGNHVGISNSAITASELVCIEDNVLIGSGCMISDTDHHEIKAERRNRGDEDEIAHAPIYIKNGAFIGARTIILKGVTIGENAVIGAGAVVTKDVPSNEIWAGNPAKFIRKIY